jgi:hypothetical protein
VSEPADKPHCLTPEEREVAEALEAARRSAKRLGGWEALPLSRLQHAGHIKDRLRKFASAGQEEHDP